MADQTVSWFCGAYGSEGIAFGADCFFPTRDGKRTCGSMSACAGNLEAERIRLFNYIHTRAAEGDPVALAIAPEFPSPDDLLGGPPAPM